jgi:RHS repeat-associated protein
MGTIYYAPYTNVEEDAEYDACGTLVSSGKTENWHIVGNNVTAFGWHAGEVQEIPAYGSHCFGDWTMKYTWTQTFADGETLTDSFETSFEVNDPYPASSTWGGGNPSELPCAQACSGDPVNTATGDFYETTTDMVIPGRGPDLEVTRTYSSLAANAGAESAFGRGWSFTYDMALKIDPETGDAVILNGNGSRTEFFATEEGDFVASSRVLASLVENENGTYTYAVKKKAIYTFDEEGRLIAIGDLNGEELDLAYDESGLLSEVSDGEGRSLIFGFDEEDRLEEVSDPTGRSVNYAYDEAGDLSEVVDVRGGKEAFEYDEGGLLIEHEDTRGVVVVENSYDAGGRVVSQLDSEEGTTTFEYGPSPDTLETITTEVNPRGVTTEYIYLSRVLQRRIEAVGTEWEATWSYERDPSTNAITKITDPNGKSTSADYDLKGNQIWTEDALGRTTESKYTALGDLEEYVDAEGVKTTYHYDESGNLLKTSRPLVGSEPNVASVVKYERGDPIHRGDVTEVVDPRGKATVLEYDADGNLGALVSAEGDETRYDYDQRGNLTETIGPAGNVEGGVPAEATTSFSYDQAGNRLSVITPTKAEELWTYDPVGNVESHTDGAGRTTKYEYVGAGRRVLTTLPSGREKSMAYDGVGNVVSQSDGLEQVTQYAYNPLGDLQTSTDPLERTFWYNRDKVGNILSTYDPGAGAVNYSYDDAYQLERVDYSDEVTPSVEYEYDDFGRWTQMVDGTGESTFDFDSLGRLVSTTNGDGSRVDYGYDLADNVTSIKYPNGKTVLRSVDDAGRLATVSDWLGRTTEFQYDKAGRLSKTIFLAGESEGAQLADEYGYDVSGGLIDIAFGQGGVNLASLSYQRNGVGQVTKTDTEGLPGLAEQSVVYDVDGRLTEAGAEVFSYDDADQLTGLDGSESVFDPASQLESQDATHFKFDALGRRTKADQQVATFDSMFGGEGSEDGEFSHPGGMVVDANGDLWVADVGNDRVQKLDDEGNFLSSFGSTGSGNGQFDGPTDIDIDSEGNLWVVDSGNSRVQKFSASGEYVSQLGSAGAGNGQLAGPKGLAIDEEDDVWVADSGNHRVQEFRSSGEFVQVIGVEGGEEETIFSPTSVAVSPNGHVLVAEYGRCRVSEFDQTGSFVDAFGSVGQGDGEFFGTPMLEVDDQGMIWVGDQGNARIEYFNADGRYLGEIGTRGSGEGQLDFSVPSGIAADDQGMLWVSDSLNNRIQGWLLPQAAPAAPLRYRYDQAGNLISIKRAAGSEAPAIDESYEYDGVGLRAAQTVSGVTKQWTWDASGELPLLLDDGGMSYIYGPGGVPIAQIADDGETSYFHRDQLGSTRMLTNPNGEVTGTFTYGAYGERTAATGTVNTPFGYAGQYTNAESGLQYLRARVYDPSTAQFLSRDPLSAITGEVYGYAGSDPMNRVDPTGLCNLNPFSGDFWTEGNCISESPLNPIPYYEREIEALEAGCSYWESVQYGLQGAVAGTAGLGFLLSPLGLTQASLGRASYWVEMFAVAYPRTYLFALQQISKIGSSPPVAGTAAATFLEFVKKGLAWYGY